jgi:EAL domain-containing protein (putative c-di-GMP-specific phosphodiesterase class I)
MSGGGSDELIAAIGAMGRALDIEVAADGVMGKAQASFLRHIGCIFAQGPYWSGSVALDQLGDLWTNPPASA